MHKIQKKKKIKLIQLNSKYVLKLWLKPSYKVGNFYAWVASMCIGKSIRQINDWYNKRKNKRAKYLNSNLIGTFAMKPQLMAIDQIRNWAKELPEGDAIYLVCESAKPLKQFKIWKKWFEKNEDPAWVISEEHMSFYYYKNKV